MINIVGPLQPHYTVSIGGYIVPNLKLYKISDQEYNVVVASWSAVVHIDDLEQYVFLLANAMAYAAGYTSHGQFSTMRNDYKVQIKRVSDSDSEK